MTKEDIIRMAREAGWDMDDTVDGFSVRLERFHQLAVAAEREACAKVADDQARKVRIYVYAHYACGNIADAIRARGNT